MIDIRLLHKFFQGLASAEESVEIKAWLDSSPENGKRLLAERKIYDAILLNGGAPEVSQYLHPAGSTGKIRWRMPAYAKEMAKIAAVAVVTLLGGWFFLSQEKADVNTLAMQTITVPSGQRLNLVLPDGTNVWLNAGTTARYPVAFNTKERLVSIDGQAYFEVARNGKVPFIVKTPRGKVEALGTKFDVSDYSRRGGDFQAMLVEGGIKVHLSGKEPEFVILAPEEKAFARNGKLEVVRVEDFSAYRWKEGLISFRNEPFGEIMKSFENAYDITIAVENERIKSISYTGKFRMSDGIEYALRVLQRDVDFTFERDADGDKIHIR